MSRVPSAQSRSNGPLVCSACDPSKAYDRSAVPPSADPAGGLVTDAARDLVGLSRQVLYEFEMVEALAKRLTDLSMGTPQPGWKERFGTSSPLERDWFERNAMLESLLIHVRALTKFLFKPPPPPEKRAARGRRGGAAGLADAFAEDYFSDAIAGWRKHPEGRGRRPSPITDDELNRISREIGHLTYHRAGFEEGGSNWSPYALYTALADVMERFAVRVEPEQVLPDFRERVEAALPPRQPPPRRPHNPGAYSVGPPAATQGLRPGKP
jgi:hypothetical protein